MTYLQRSTTGHRALVEVEDATLGAKVEDETIVHVCPVPGQPTILITAPPRSPRVVW